MNHSFRIGLMAALTVLAVVSCGMRGNKKSTTQPEQAPTCFDVIDTFLADSIGSQYTPGEVCIPYHSYIDVDETNPDDIQVRGDFWVDNYKVSGDTLVFVSGGSHPGKMHVKKDADGRFSVTGFDAVGDGSEFLPTAKAIFGDKFEEFQKAYSDQDKREQARKSAIASYVSRHGLKVV